MSQQKVESIPSIEHLLAHAHPMILIDRMVEFGDRQAVCEVEIRPDSLFLEDRKVRACVGVEYAAQAIGAYAGMVNYLEDRPIRIGYLLGIRQMELNIQHFCVGDQLKIEVNHVWGDLTMGSFQVLIKEGLRNCLSGTITVYAGDLPDNG